MVINCTISFNIHNCTWRGRLQPATPWVDYIFNHVQILSTTKTDHCSINEWPTCGSYFAVFRCVLNCSWRASRISKTHTSVLILYTREFKYATYNTHTRTQTACIFRNGTGRTRLSYVWRGRTETLSKVVTGKHTGNSFCRRNCRLAREISHDNTRRRCCICQKRADKIWLVLFTFVFFSIDRAIWSCSTILNAITTCPGRGDGRRHENRRHRSASYDQL